MALGCHQTEAQPLQWDNTAFSCYTGHYQFIKINFGLNNAPVTYQRCIDAVLMGLKEIDGLVCLDDIICFSATMMEHAEKLEAILKRLGQTNFKIKQEKCVFATDRVEYLGHVCRPCGIRPDPKTIVAAVQYPVLKTVRDVRDFIGHARNYRRYVRNFCRICQTFD
jgi:hypothetical protein